MNDTLKDKKILVTGASGSIAKQVIYELNKMGVSPTAHIRQNSDTSYIDSLNLEKRYADLRVDQQLEKLVEGIDMVIHTAAWVTFRQDKLTQFTGINTFGALNLFKAAQKAGVKRFLHVSTVAAVGGVKRKINGSRVDDSALMNEKSEFTTSHLRIPYMMTKRAAEEELLKAHTEGSTELVIVNPSIVASPLPNGDDRGHIIRYFNKLVIPSIPVRVNIVDVRDVAVGILSALEKGKNGQRYILGGDNIIVRDLFLIMSAELGKIPHLVRFPRKLYDITSAFYILLAKAVGKSKISYYPDLVRMLDYDWAYSSKKSHDELGYRWRSLQDTLHDLLNNDFLGTWLRP